MHFPFLSLQPTLNRRSVQQLPVSSQSSSRWRSKQTGALVILGKISIINVLGLFSCAIRLQLLISVFHYPLWLSSPIFPCSSFVVRPAMVTPDQIFIFFFLAVQDSSIGDLVTHSLTHSVSDSPFDFSVSRAVQSCCRL